MERLEDSLMVLGSMATNRYAAPFRAEVQSWIRCGELGAGNLLLMRLLAALHCTALPTCRCCRSPLSDK